MFQVAIAWGRCMCSEWNLVHSVCSHNSQVTGFWLGFCYDMLTVHLVCTQRIPITMWGVYIIIASWSECWNYQCVFPVVSTVHGEHFRLCPLTLSKQLCSQTTHLKCEWIFLAWSWMLGSISMVKYVGDLMSMWMGNGGLASVNWGLLAWRWVWLQYIPTVVHSTVYLVGLHPYR